MAVFSSLGNRWLKHYKKFILCRRNIFPLFTVLPFVLDCFVIVDIICLKSGVSMLGDPFVPFSNFLEFELIVCSVF